MQQSHRRYTCTTANARIQIKGKISRGGKKTRSWKKKKQKKKDCEALQLGRENRPEKEGENEKVWEDGCKRKTEVREPRSETEVWRLCCMNQCFPARFFRGCCCCCCCNEQQQKKSGKSQDRELNRISPSDFFPLSLFLYTLCAFVGKLGNKLNWQWAFFLYKLSFFLWRLIWNTDLLTISETVRLNSTSLISQTAR